MTDKFQSLSASLTGPATNAFAIIPDDATDLPTVTRALYVGVSGNVVVTMQSGQTVTLVNVMAGSLLPLRVARVAASDTTAQNLVGLY